MTTTALPRGRQTRLRLAYQTAFAVAATTGFQELNTYNHTFNPSRPLQDDDVLGAGFQNLVDERPAAPGLEEADAPIQVPLDLNQIGFWLKALLGAPTTSGTTTKTHVFTSGAASLPSLTLEREFAAGQFELLTGGVAKSAKFDFAPANGFRAVDLSFAARQVSAPYATTAAGSPTIQTLLNRIPASIGNIKLGGTQIGSVTAAEFMLTNDLELDRYVGDPFRSAAALNATNGEINFTARYTTDALRAQANPDATTLLPAAYAISLEYVLSATLKLVLDLPAVRFERVSIPVQNGKALTQSFKGRCEVAASSPMLTATLTNAFASY
jgi:hypothetical protein